MADIPDMPWATQPSKKDLLLFAMNNMRDAIVRVCLGQASFLRRAAEAVQSGAPAEVLAKELNRQAAQLDALAVMVDEADKDEGKP